MIIIHAVNRLQDRFIPRLLAPVIEEALGQFPVVVLTGARQTGKSTLVQHLPSARERRYRSLDDLDLLARAERSPETLLEERGRQTLDDVQNAPALRVARKGGGERGRS